MKRASLRRAATSAALFVTVTSATGCIAVSRSTRPVVPPPPEAVWQEWACEPDDGFDLATARADLRDRIHERTSEGWTFVDFEIGRVRDQTCLVASFFRSFEE